MAKPRLIELHGKYCRESIESQCRAGRYNPASVFKFEHPTLGITCRAVLASGNSDCVSMWLFDSLVFCVNTNRSLGYCGIQMFEFTEQDTRIEAGEEDGVFFQNEEDAKEIIGKHLWDYTERTIARRLIDHLLEVLRE